MFPGFYHRRRIPCTRKMSARATLSLNAFHAHSTQKARRRTTPGLTHSTHKQRCVCLSRKPRPRSPRSEDFPLENVTHQKYAVTISGVQGEGWKAKDPAFCRTPDPCLSIQVQQTLHTSGVYRQVLGSSRVVKNSKALIPPAKQDQGF
jgi:hypothetical protein